MTTLTFVRNSAVVYPSGPRYFPGAQLQNDPAVSSYPDEIYPCTLLQIEAGKPLAVEYRDTPEPGEQPELAGTVNLHYRLAPDDEVTIQELSPLPLPANCTDKLLKTQIVVPETAEGSLELWFEFNPKKGKNLRKSRSELSCQARILPAPSSTLSFTAPDGNILPAPVLRGLPMPGQSLSISYDLDRTVALGLKTILLHNRPQKPTAIGCITFWDSTGSELESLKWTVSDSAGVPVKIPHAASFATVNFTGTDYLGVHRMDTEPSSSGYKIHFHPEKRLHDN